MNCKNCNTEVEQNDMLICYEHDVEYCVWCAIDNKGNCDHFDGKCQIGIDDGIPF